MERLVRLSPPAETRSGTLMALAACVTAAGLMLAGCGGSDSYGGGTGPDDTDDGTGPAAGVVQIDMVGGNEFEPQVDTVTAGDTVRWTNENSVTHTATADDGSWDSGDVDQGESYQRAFTETGDHPYHCVYHGSPGSGMHGTIVVEP